MKKFLTVIIIVTIFYFTIKLTKMLTLNKQHFYFIYFIFIFLNNVGLTVACGECQFWDCLQKEKSLIREHTFPRFAEKGLKYNASLLDGIDNFDYEHFGISEETAKALDPQHRLILESVEEAIEDSGLTLKNTITNVYIAIAHQEYGAHNKYSFDSMAGLSHSMLGLRLKAHLVIKGEYQHIDTACSSFLVAIHRASNDLKRGLCKYAIVTGANLLLHPGTFAGFDCMKLLAPDGIVRSFDENASGYARGEGVGTLVLSAANVDNYCQILATAQTQNGIGKPPIFRPDSVAHEELHHTLQKTATADYLELHGTGTRGGDVIESHALVNVYGKNCPILGCCKPTWGHTEIISGLMEIVKALCVLHYQEVPANLNLEKLSSKIPKDFNYQAKKAPIQAKIAGCHSFGFSGTNAGLLFVVGKKWENKSKHKWNHKSCWLHTEVPDLEITKPVKRT